MCLISVDTSLPCPPPPPPPPQALLFIGRGERQILGGPIELDLADSLLINFWHGLYYLRADDGTESIFMPEALVFFQPKGLICEMTERSFSCVLLCRGTIYYILYILYIIIKNAHKLTLSFINLRLSAARLADAPSSRPGFSYPPHDSRGRGPDYGIVWVRTILHPAARHWVFSIGKVISVISPGPNQKSLKCSFILVRQNKRRRENVCKLMTTEQKPKVCTLLP